VFFVSVIIPTLNEAPVLDATLRALEKNATRHEVIVVDGGSTDGTLALARSHGTRVVTCRWKNRSRQMNEGRKAARGGTLLFLHADTLVDPTALETLSHMLATRSAVGGGFVRRYASSSKFLRLTCHLATWRCQWFGWFLGDQAIFVTSPVFDALGGYQDMALFEDLDFSRRMKSHGRLVTVPIPVLSSPRRFSRRGPWRTTLADLGLTVRYLLGRPSGRSKPPLSAVKKSPWAEPGRSDLSKFTAPRPSPGAGQPPGE